MPARGKYTDPDLRDEIKEEIHQGDKGGAPGQWSARKAQMMASEYKKRGGGYTTDKKDQDESQKHLSKWTEEEWQTKEGSAHAKQEDGLQKRYLPKKAWEQMSEEEKQETDEKKIAESKEGRQYVENTDKAKSSRRKANNERDAEYESKEAEEKQSGKEGVTDEEVGEEQEEVSQGDEEYQDESEESGHSQADEDVDDASDGGEDESPQPGKKRGRGSTKAKSSNKRQKNNPEKSQQKNGTTGGKKDPAEPPAKPGSKDRLPEKGQKVHWKSLPGYIEGEVVEVVYEEKEVDGKQAKGSENDPRIVLKSSSSGKIAVHKPEAVFFD